MNPKLLKEKEFIEVKLIYEDDSKAVERRELKPIKTMVRNNNRASQKKLYATVKNDYDIIYNIINSINNSGRKNFKKYDQRKYTNEDFKKMYKNLDNDEDN